MRLTPVQAIALGKLVKLCDRPSHVEVTRPRGQAHVRVRIEEPEVVRLRIIEDGGQVRKATD